MSIEHCCHGPLKVRFWSEVHAQDVVGQSLEGPDVDAIPDPRMAKSEIEQLSIAHEPVLRPAELNDVFQ